MAPHEPTNWAWQNYAASQFIIEALRRTNGNTDSSALAKEISGMTVKKPFGGAGITMRDSDHTIISTPSHGARRSASHPGWSITSIRNGRRSSSSKEWKKEKGYA